MPTYTVIKHHPGGGPTIIEWSFEIGISLEEILAVFTKDYPTVVGDAVHLTPSGANPFVLYLW